MSIIGHKNNLEKFSALILKRQFPQTSLWYGQSGIGKKKVARQIAGVLLCESPKEKEGGIFCCEACHSCRLFLSGNHPDFFLVAPTVPKTKKKTPFDNAGGSIKVEQIQDVKRRLVYAPLISRYQIVVIDDAELMTKTTANSLLKILEEPRPNQIFILITSQFNQILVTIRSRSVKFFFSPLTEEEVRDVLPNLAEDSLLKEKKGLVSFYLKCFPGSPSCVAKALELPFSLKDYEKLIQKKGNFLEISALAKECVREEMSFSIFLEVLRGFFLQEVRGKVQEEIVDLKFFEKLSNAKRQEERYISKEFILENLFL